ncbi:MAG: NADH-quinone oxidoreductase subunit K [Candidatus Bipolaricaulaceae bacterium]
MDGRIAVALALSLTALGLWVVVRRRNLVWKLLGLNVASSGAVAFLVALAHRPGARPPWPAWARGRTPTRCLMLWC